MITTFASKLENFRLMVEVQQIQRLKDSGLDCEDNLNNARVTIKPGSKYVKVDVGDSGKYMVEVATGNIFGIKAYGQIHKGHFFGTLNSIDEYYWGNYSPTKKDGTLKTQKTNGYPVITRAPDSIVP